MNAPTFLSLFSGIGGFDLALERSGWRCVGQVELDPFCQRVLAGRFPSIPRHGDIRSFAIASETRQQQPERVDLLVGGFPCQDFSVAGKRAGLVGYRGTLFWEIVRIAKILTPAWGLFENVPGLLSSSHGRDFWAVLQGLRECWPAVGWRILDSRYFGVPQRRRRVFFVCGPSEEAVASVLFEPTGSTGHPAAGGEAGARVAASLTGGSHRPGVNAPGRRKEDDENLVIAATLNSGGNDGGFRTEPGEHLVVDPLTTKPYADNEAQHRRLVVARPLRAGRTVADTYGDEGNIITHALSAEGADASEDGTGRGTPIIPIQYAEQWGRDKRQNGMGLGEEGDPSFTLDASYPHGVGTGASVRRLTPLECERLQAFPDGWTCLCQPLDAYAADPEQATWNCKCPDGPRYRALGNAVTVSVVQWLGRRLMEVHHGLG